MILARHPAARRPRAGRSRTRRLRRRGRAAGASALRRTAIGLTAIGLAAIGLAACQAAEAQPATAQPAANLGAAAHPAGWRALPAIAAAVAAAARADNAIVEGADAWGEPAIGCYAVWLTLRGADAAAPVLAEQILTSAAALSPTAIVRPTAADGVLGFGFARPPYRGQLRARLGGGRVSAVACFANQREPQVCDAACPRVLESVL